ncbi:nucleotidyltransferase family protein [Motiliproteus coralliicola]|uniref:Nucleotidyltransferase family protein n=1 Tax=Motiliproteus coralliicola TaxID=2283196 RepID=A0A369WD16_9GAMM|nr:nucleotidyltransferase family protein [Motiliproteus coralliicola]RDE19527.1 nucleotidyltransferase family protein [Motiliproteus coralliicola]
MAMRMACLLMAAGAGSRFGSVKQLADIHGKPMLQHALEQLQPLFGEDLFCVVGAHRQRLASIVQPRAQLIENPDWQQGLGVSIARGVEAIRRQDKDTKANDSNKNYDALLIALADQAALLTQDYRYLINHTDGDRIVAAEYAQRAGVPALFPASFFNELEQLDGDQGARRLLQPQEQCGRLIKVALPGAQLDIDTPADLKALV